MKILFVCVVLSALQLASWADVSYVGAYYSTHAPSPNLRESGAMTLTLLDDGAATMTEYYSSNVVRVATGTHALLRNGTVKVELSITNGAPHVFTFKGTAKNGFVSGSWKLSGTAFRGKWQGTQPTNGPASLQADLFLDFSDTVPGEVITLAGIENSAKGPSLAWERDGDGDVFTTLKTEYAPSVALPVPVTVTNRLFTETGTNWLRFWHTNDQTLDALTFLTPGEYGGQYKAIMVRALVRFGSTNNTGTLVNYDHIMIQGNPFCVCQQQDDGNGLNAVLAHASEQNGAWIHIQRGKLYYVTLYRDATLSRCSLALYDPANNFALVGTSEGTMGDSAWSYSWLVYFQANYFGHTDGFTEMGGISIEYVNPVNALFPP